MLKACLAISKKKWLKEWLIAKILSSCVEFIEMLYEAKFWRLLSRTESLLFLPHLPTSLCCIVFPSPPSSFHIIPSPKLSIKYWHKSHHCLLQHCARDLKFVSVSLVISLSPSSNLIFFAIQNATHRE